MAIEVFNRYENKYLLDERTLDRLEKRLCEYMEPDSYNKVHGLYPVRNLYYDTPDHHLIRTSLAKPYYKEKLRLRAYGAPGELSESFVEIKKKVGGLVNKRRSAMILEDAYAFLETGEVAAVKPYMNPQVLREIRYLLERYELRPSMYLAYERRAYFDMVSPDLRVSFDCNIHYRETDLRLEADAHGTRLLEENQWLMEIKSAHSIPLWLARLLAENRIYPVSFSKYGSAYCQSLAAAAPNVVTQQATKPHTANESKRIYGKQEGYVRIPRPHTVG